MLTVEEIGDIGGGAVGGGAGDGGDGTALSFASEQLNNRQPPQPPPHAQAHPDVIANQPAAMAAAMMDAAYVYGAERLPQPQQLQPQQLHGGKHLLSESNERVDAPVDLTGLSVGLGASNDSSMRMASAVDPVMVMALLNDPKREAHPTPAAHDRRRSHGPLYSTPEGRNAGEVDTTVVRVSGVTTSKGASPAGGHFMRPRAASAAADPDAGELMDLKDFHYLMQQPGCGPHVKALILVHTAPGNHDKRLLIRETWGGAVIRGTPLRVIFLLGAVARPELQGKLRSENSLYGDMVQGSFIDDYRNMTYKHVMALKWFLRNCGHAQILIKTDDDVFVNTPQLLAYERLSADSPATKHHHRSPPPSPPSSPSEALPFNAAASLFQYPRDLLLCVPIVGSRASRSWRSKWRVSRKEYNDRYYPTYCPGFVIVYSSDVVGRLYAAAQNQKYFWIDDVLITGILAHSTNITITTSLHYMLTSKEYERLVRGKTDASKSKSEYIYGQHGMTPQEIRDIWHYYEKLSPLSTTTATTATTTTPPPPPPPLAHQSVKGRAGT